MLDISSWCNSMRKECANTVFSLFDNLYGFKNMFQRAHDFFSDSLKYVNNNDTLIRVNKDWNPEASFTKYQGSFEGMKQKPWTIFTVTLIEMALRKTRVPYHLIGQGDNRNVVLSHHLTNQETNKSITTWNEISNVTIMCFDLIIIKMFSRSGLEVKKLKSLCSSKIMFYGKEIYSNSLNLSKCLKSVS